MSWHARLAITPTWGSRVAGSTPVSPTDRVVEVDGGAACEELRLRVCYAPRTRISRNRHVPRCGSMPSQNGVPRPTRYVVPGDCARYWMT